MRIKNVLLAIIMILLSTVPVFANSDLILVTSDSCRTCVSFEKENGNILKGIERLTIETEKGLSIYKSDKEADNTILVPYLRDKNGDIIVKKESIITYLTLGKVNGNSLNSHETKSILFITLTSAIIDSFNPCALFALIYIITMLSSIDITRKKLIDYVVIYAITVFTVYTTIGLVSLEVLNRIINLETYSKATGVFIILVTVVVMILTLIKGKENSKEPTEIVSKYFEEHSWSRVTTVIVLAFILSITEFACTGQIYLPTLMVLSASDVEVFSKYHYLLLYNIIFIIPIIAVGISYIVLKDKASSIMVFLLNSREKTKIFSIIFYLLIIAYVTYKYIL